MTKIYLVMTDYEPADINVTAKDNGEDIQTLVSSAFEVTAMRISEQELQELGVGINKYLKEFI